MTGLPPWWALVRTRRTARGALRRIDAMNVTITEQAQQLRQQDLDIKRLTGRVGSFH